MSNMCNPGCEPPKIYVWGTWIRSDYEYVVTHDNEPNIKSFDKLDEAVNYIKEQIVQNVNINYHISQRKPIPLCVNSKINGYLIKDFE